MATRKEELSKLEARGVTGALAEELLARGSASRHGARVMATVKAACNAPFMSVEHRAYALLEVDDPYHRALAACLILADYIGTGGTRDLGGLGCGTPRMPFFEKLGSGRWKANDGAAYRSASVDAFQQLMPPDWVIGPIEEDYEEGGSPWILGVHPHGNDQCGLTFSYFPQPWRRNLTIQVAAAVVSGEWPEWLEVILPRSMVDFTSSAEAWSATANVEAK